MKPYTSDQFDRATAIAAQCFGKVTFPSWDAAHRIMRADMEAFEPSPSDREWVYFARGRNTGLIKIGLSKQPEFRVGQLKHDRFFGDEADLLVTRRGHHWERAYHMVFEPWRFCGEWFAPHPDILAEVDRLNAMQNGA